MRLPMKNQLRRAACPAVREAIPRWLAPLCLVASFTAVSTRASLVAQENASVGAQTREAEKEGSTEGTPGTAPDSRSSGLPPGVIARINGREVSIEEYASYLFATFGKSKLDDYIDRLLIEEEAQRLAITVAPDQVEAALDERIERTVKSFYEGERQQFLENLARRRTTLAEYKARWRQRMYYDMLLEEVVLRTRKITPEALLEEFTRSYREGGVQYVLRHILISKRLRTSEGPVRSDAEARTRAEEILKELENGLDFVQAVKQYSDDTFTKRNEGRIVHYRKGFYGDEFDQAVARLTAERPRSGVVASPRGYSIIQLIERRVTKFDDVKVDLEAFFKTRPPTVQEKHELLAQLREKAEIEGLD